jgi:hypothetical protein
MVDDIHFPRGLPPIPPSGGVQRVNRKKREEEKPPFEKFLGQEDQKDKKKRKGPQESDPVDILSETEILAENKSTQSSGATGSEAAAEEEDIEKKIIDVRV